MAKATVEQRGVVVTLEMTEAEARYVKRALRDTDPTNEECRDMGVESFKDPVWDALDEIGCE